MNILSINIQTNNLEVSKQFYTEVLQLPIIESLEENFTLQVGQSILTFEQTDVNVEIYHYAFNIPSNQIENALVWAKAHLSLIENVEGNLVTTFETWKAKSIYFTDNNGNILEFIAREDIQVNVQGDFSPSQIINISEMGIVTEQPMVQAEKLIADYGLSYFEKNEPTEQFLALGDDHGLLIMVTPNRNWYPTSIAAQFTPAEIMIESNELVVSLLSEESK
ncbi:glyoxalase [Myroides marinus]|uniref:VOC family protein n=1 Tax=Myroides marinus TaxID=703342 RepID=UPI00257845B9|nr:VOC family protein [Myroides marinus]MDM1348313.1 glyoxalase [Myroides marinus]MDM1351856.1 glyoxalase [Myroides marinus]MDM1355415.1 glyoxalase [Myroides marinus]MDM1359032.1 glyoxalase [Myroides marinus]MDM1366841.1 glyoxalase [Myroides marinus]